MEIYSTHKDKGASKVEAIWPKVAPKPNWKWFPGFSYLFDNPGSSLKAHEDITQVSMLSIENLGAPELELYKALDTAMKQIDPEEVAHDFELFLLPSSTYHVTVWDGMNINNMAEQSSSPEYKNYHEMLHDYFKDPFKSSMESWPPLSEELEYGNDFDNMGKVRFKFNAMAARENTVLVANLEPADPESIEQLAEIEKQRGKLDERFKQYGKPINAELWPHVAIGYFANEQLAKNVGFQKIDKWREIFKKETSGCTIEFSSISLYAFSDMLTYFKSS